MLPATQHKLQAVLSSEIVYEPVQLVLMKGGIFFYRNKNFKEENSRGSRPVMEWNYPDVGDENECNRERGYKIGKGPRHCEGLTNSTRTPEMRAASQDMISDRQKERSIEITDMSNLYEIITSVTTMTWLPKHTQLISWCFGA